MVGATTAEAIREKALELGYDDCGIVRVEEVADYADSLARRIERFPHSKPMYERFYGYAQPAERYPWARSVVVCASWYGKYRIPEKMQGIAPAGSTVLCPLIKKSPDRSRLYG